jgi:hypothetical protein
MTNTNIFKNKYSVAEDKLTYYFLAMLDLLDDETQKQFFEKIFNYNLICKPLTDISFQTGGDNSRIDASFSLECVDGKKIIHLENKTYTCALTVEQLNNHKKFYCKNNEDLLVISPRHDDAEIAKKINFDRLTFKRWSEIIELLQALSNETTTSSLLIHQFIIFAREEYNLISEEIVTKKDLSSLTSQNYKDTVKRKIESLFKIFIKEDTFFNKCFSLPSNRDPIKTNGVETHWGRHGIEFIPDVREFGQWFFYGIYYETKNHKLKFLNSEQPELAFFFDCYDSNMKDKLTNSKDFKLSISKLIKKGFEENVSGDKATYHRIIFKRKSLSDFDKINVKIIKNEFELIMSEILQEKPFRKMMLNIN